MNNLTIVPADHLVIVDDHALELDPAHFIDLHTAKVHAVQWNGSKGHIEYTDERENAPLDNIQPYQTLIGAHTQARHRLERSLAAKPWQDYHPTTDTYTSDLARLVQHRRDAIQTLFEEKRQLGCVYDHQRFDSDEKAQTNLANALQRALNAQSLGIDFQPLDWTTSDNQPYAITKLETLQALNLAVGDQVEALYTVRNRHKAAISALEEETAILAYDISTDWPSSTPDAATRSE